MSTGVRFDCVERPARRWPAIRWLVVCGVTTGAAMAGTIVHPWNAAPRIVARGESFPAYIATQPDESFDSLVLSGPYNRLRLETTAQPGRFIYDQFTRKTYNLHLSATVPVGAPAELYDLEVYTTAGVAVSRRSVSVVREYRHRYQFVHIADAHISRNWTDGRAQEIEQTEHIVRVVNIICPEFVIHTGDCIMDYTRMLDSAGAPVISDGSRGAPPVTEKWGNYYDGAKGFLGFRSFDCAFFSTPGNHDYYNTGSRAAQWNDLCGLRVYNFTYGTGRFMAFDDYLGGDFSSLQKSLHKAFLDSADAGQLRVIAQHDPGRVDEAFCRDNGVHMALVGHYHSNSESTVGQSSSLLVQTANAGRDKNMGWFRLVTAEADRLVSLPAMRYGDTNTKTDDLALTFTAPNNGSVRGNSAIIRNNFSIGFPYCRVRFVMAPGNYTASAGYVEQVIDNDTVSVYDVRVPVDAGSSVSVTLQAGASTALRPAGREGPRARDGLGVVTVRPFDLLGRQLPVAEFTGAAFVPMVTAVTGLSTQLPRCSATLSLVP